MMQCFVRLNLVDIGKLVNQFFVIEGYPMKTTWQVRAALVGTTLDFVEALTSADHIDGEALADLAQQLLPTESFEGGVGFSLETPGSDQCNRRHISEQLPSRGDVLIYLHFPYQWNYMKSGEVFASAPVRQRADHVGDCPSCWFQFLDTIKAVLADRAEILPVRYRQPEECCCCSRPVTVATLPVYVFPTEEESEPTGVRSLSKIEVHTLCLGGWHLWGQLEVRVCNRESCAKRTIFDADELLHT